VVWAAAAVVFLAGGMLAASLGWAAHDRASKRDATERVVNPALDEAEQWQRRGRIPEALSAAQRAAGLVAGGTADEPLRRRVQARADDLALVAALEEARLQMSGVTGGSFDTARGDRRYGEIFREFRRDVESGPVEDVGRCLRESTVPVELAAALDHWAMTRRHLKGWGDASWKRMLAVARATDPDDQRDRLRRALQERDRQALVAMVEADSASHFSVPTALALGKALRDLGAVEESLALLKGAQQRHSDDFWINMQTVLTLRSMKPARHEELVRYCTAAVALRPQSPGAHVNLGATLHDKGDLPAAIAEFREAVRLRDEYAAAHNNLGGALGDNGDVDGSIEEYQEAIRIDKDFPEPHTNLGNALRGKGDLDGAIEECRKAIALKSDEAGFHENLGLALKAKGDLDAAIGAFREAIRIKDDDAQFHYNLGNALKARGNPDESVAAYRQAIRIDKDYAEAHCNLGLVLLNLGKFPEALPYLRRGHELGSKNPSRWRYPSEQWIKACERQIELDAKLTRVLKGEVKPADAGESAALAVVCQLPARALYAAATRLYSGAFAAQPKLADDLRAGHRYRAACCAALAGCGQGDDAARLDNVERARLRKLAFDWLTADLAARAELDAKPEARTRLRQTMETFKKDTKLAGVRDAAGLAKLPEAERGDWQKLWAEVAARLNDLKTSEPTPAAKP
jgi:tetratricopeptide (TPR) repeat protein